MTAACSSRRSYQQRHSALKAKRAELAGEADAVERHLAQLRADLVHLDAVLRMFDPAAKPDAMVQRMVSFPGASSTTYAPSLRP